MPSCEQDPYARVACESLLTTGLVCLAGEITTKAMVDYPAIVRQIVPRDRLHIERHGLRRIDLRRHGRPGKAVARYRPGR